MARYRTEIEIPPDRYVHLQLPADMPEGRATVTVMSHDPGASHPSPPVASNPDHEDIEWWDEFDEELEAPG